MIDARQSTARTFTVGPILDADGLAVTTVTVDKLKIKKNGGASAALNGSATLTHDVTGHFSLALTTSDLDTVGVSDVVLNDGTNACQPLRIRVIEEAVYDALYAAAAAGYGTLDAAGVRAAIGMGVADYDTDISNITSALDVVNLALTDNLDVAVSTRAATGDAMTLADGAITDAKITFPAEASGRATTFLAAMRRLWEWTVNKRIRDRATGAVTLRNAADSADLEGQTQSTSGAVGSEVDTQTKGV